MSSKILVWNVRGINSQEKQDAIRDKINESACQIICIQETKRENFDSIYIKRFCPRSFDKFAFSPSIGASGGLITIWNSRFFEGTTIQTNAYAITIKFVCKQDNKSFHVSNIYGPAHSAQKMGFVTWLMNLDSSKFKYWLLARDFNLYRNPKNRNKPGGDISKMYMFNELISDLDFHDIPFSGRNYT